MMLSNDQIASYQRDGYLAPIDVLSADEAATLAHAIVEAEQRWPQQLDDAGRNNAHFVLPELDALVHNEKILDAVEGVLGPNILACGTTLFLKEPDGKSFISWHQDARYVALEPHNWVTAWLALVDVDEHNGCMRMWPSSHQGDLVHHDDTYAEDNLLTRGQHVPNVPMEETVPVVLKAGQLSLHHPRIVHGSGANNSDHRRMGFAIQSYIAPDVEQLAGNMYVQLCRGEDKYQHHAYGQRPSAPMISTDVAFRDKANADLADILYHGTQQRGRY